MNEMWGEAHSSNRQPPFHSSGSADIDIVRHEVELSPSSGDNYRRRSLLLYMWLSALQQPRRGGELCIYRDKVFVLAADDYVHAIK